MKKLFGGINLTWKKVIIFAVISAIYTACMAIIPITKDTSFRDIAIQFEWWILFGIIIITNSKSPKDSALKCFVFFLISQPLIYLIQVPFSYQGWHLFAYYKYWFIWTLLTIPMGFIGYYIKKNNILSMIILLPMLILLAYLGLGYLSAVIDNFPHHLLSSIACLLMIILIVLNLFDKNKLKVITLLIVLIISVIYLILKGELINQEYETYRSLDEYDIELIGDVYVSSFTGTAMGNVQVINADDSVYTIKLNGRKKGKYIFTLTDENNSEYDFEYYYDKEGNTVVLNRRK